jgi:hypothetical protein
MRFAGYSYEVDDGGSVGLHSTDIVPPRERLVFIEAIKRATLDVKVVPRLYASEHTHTYIYIYTGPMYSISMVLKWKSIARKEDRTHGASKWKLYVMRRAVHYG